MEAIQHQRHSVDEYLKLEEQSEVKHEYIDGQITAMAGGEPAHSLIANNICGELRNSLKGRSCRVYNADLQIAVSWSRYTYPDGSVVCGPLQHLSVNKQAVSNPTLLVEVLSESTEKYDRGRKFERYRQIPTFREYVLVSQTKPLVEIYYKLEDNVWRMSTHEGLDKTIRFESIGVEIAMQEVYLDVEFPADPDAELD